MPVGVKEDAAVMSLAKVAIMGLVLVYCLLFIILPTVHGKTTGCDHIKADIIFLIDASGSVTGSNFVKELEFAADLSGAFQIGRSALQVGVTRFSDQVKEMFNLQRYDVKADLVAAIRQIGYTEGGTDTAQGLDFIRQHGFKQASGDRLDAPNIVILLTDGRSKNAINTAASAKQLRDMGVEIYKLGIGSGIQSSELETVATDSSHVTMVAGFNELAGIKNAIRDSLCSIGQPTIAATSPQPTVTTTNATVDPPRDPFNRTIPFFVMVRGTELDADQTLTNDTACDQYSMSFSLNGDPGTNYQNVTLTIEAIANDSYTPDLNAHCYVNWGDGWDGVDVFYFGSSSHTLHHSYKYGVYKAYMVCYRDWLYHFECPTHGQCTFLPNLFFPERYKNFDTPILAFREDKLTLTAEYPFTSLSIQKYTWSIARIEENNTFTPIYDFEQPNSWNLILPGGTLSNGPYIVSLTVLYSDNSPCADSVFVKVIPYHVTTRISGGSFITVSLGTPLHVDATLSTDRSGLGAIGNWSKVYYPPLNRTTDFQAQLEMFRTQFELDPISTSIPDGGIDDGVPLGNDWFLDDDTSIYPDDTYLIVTFSLTSPESSSSAMQVVHVVENALPLNISFLYNTNAERFTSEKLQVEAFLPDEVTLGLYNWTIYRWETIGSFWNNIRNVLTTSTGYTSSSLSLAKDQFEPFRLYRLTVNASADGYNSSIVEVIKLGNGKFVNGSCSITPSFYGSNTYLYWFTLSCQDWEDEDPFGTNDLGAPTYYIYQETISDGVTVTEPVHRSKMDISLLLLKPGDPDTGHVTTVHVRVTDIYGDYTEDVPISVEVLPDTTMVSITATENGQSQIEAFMDSVKNTYDYLSTVGELFYQAQLISSAAQHLLSIPLYEHIAPVDQLLSQSNILDITLMDRSFDDLGSALAENSIVVNDSLPAIREATAYLTTKLKNLSASASDDRLLVIKLLDVVRVLDANEKALSPDTKDVIITLSEQLASYLSADERLSDEDTELIFSNLMTSVKSTVPDAMIQVRRIANLIDARRQIRQMVRMLPDSTDLTNFAMSPEERAYLYTVVQGDLEYTKFYRKKNAKSAAKYVRKMIKEILKKFKLCKNCKTQGGDKKQKKPDMLRYQANKIAEQLLELLQSKIQFDNFTKSVPGLGSTETTTLSAVELTENTFMYDDDDISSIISSRILKIDVQGGWSGPVIPEFITFEQSIVMPSVKLTTPLIDPEDASEMSLHKFIYQSITDDVCVLIDPLDKLTVLEYKVYLRFREAPTLLAYDAVLEVNNFTDWSTCFRREQLFGTQRLIHLGIHVPGIVKTIQYRFTLVTVACLNWDETVAKWRPDKCELTWLPRDSKIRCYCQNVRELTFGNSFYAAPNSIDFSTVFLKFSPLSQAAVFGTLASIGVVYIIAVVILHRKDQKDVLKWGITPLSDNLPCDEQYYVITVYTGMRRNAGTTSKIWFILTGIKQRTKLRRLSDGIRQHTTGSCISYLMADGSGIGPLEHLRIWHDNTGKGEDASWYLNQIEVYDVSRREIHTFVAERWLSPETSIEADLHAKCSQVTLPFENRFFSQTRDRLAEGHLIMSIFYRPHASVFTRVQRASCALTYLLLTMLASAMFFNPDLNYETPPLFQLGPLRFTVKQLYVSLVSALLTTPAAMLLVSLFKYSRPWSKMGRTGCFQKLCCGPCCSSSCYCRASKRKQAYIEADELKKMLLTDDVSFTSGRCTLPAGFRVLAWLLLALCSGAACFFVLLYSMEWGKQKSEEWLTTFIMSLLESTMLIDPLFVIGIAFLLACIVRKPGFDKEAYIDEVVNKYKIQQRKRGDVDYRQVLGLLRSITREARHGDINMQKKDKSLRRRSAAYLRDMKSNRLLMELIMALILLAGITSVAYSNRDVQAIYLRQQLLSQMSPVRGLTYEKVTNKGEYIAWLNKTVIPNLFPEFDIYGAPLHWTRRDYTSGRVTFRVGPPRLRQLRVRPAWCRLSHIDEVNCYHGYVLLEEEDGDYCVGWTRQENGACPTPMRIYNITTPAWSFTSGLDIWGLPIIGSLTGYGGGGYIAEWDVNRNISIKVINELYTNLWIDRATRAVVLEFTLYNPATNLFMYCEFLTEFGEMGGAMKSYRIFPLKLSPHHGANVVSTILGEVISVLYMLILAVKLGISVVKHRMKFFRSFWMLFDLVILLCGLAAIYVFIMRMIFADKTLEKFHEDKKAFVNFAHIVLWDDILSTFLGLLAFLSTIRILEIFSSSKRVEAVVMVFRSCGGDLSWFSLSFLVILLGFGTMGRLLFGSSLKSYKSVYNGITTLFLSLLGKNKYNEMNDAAPILSKIFFLLYTMAVIMFVMTIFMSILCASIDQTIHNMRKRNRVDFVEVLLQKLVKFITPVNRKRNAVHKRYTFPLQKPKRVADIPRKKVYFSDT